MVSARTYSRSRTEGCLVLGFRVSPYKKILKPSQTRHAAATDAGVLSRWAAFWPTIDHGCMTSPLRLLLAMQVRDLKEELSKAWHARKVAGAQSGSRQQLEASMWWAACTGSQTSGHAGWPLLSLHASPPPCPPDHIHAPDPFRTCPGDMKMACETSGAGFSRRGTEASETAGLDEEAHWGGGSSSGGEESLKRRSGPHLGTAAAAAAAEEGRHGGGGSGSDGTEGAPAATFAQRMAGHAGPLRSRGHLAAVLCKARQDVLLSVFVTRPAVWSPFINVCQEFIAMTIM